MSTRMLTGVVLFCVFITGYLVGNTFLFMMIEEVNRKRDHENQVSYFGLHYFKAARIWGEYRKAYPAGRNHIYALIALAVALIGLGGVALCLEVLGG